MVLKLTTLSSFAVNLDWHSKRYAVTPAAFVVVMTDPWSFDSNVFACVHPYYPKLVG